MEIKTQDLREAIRLLTHGTTATAVSASAQTTPVPENIRTTLTQGKEDAAGISLLVSMSYKSLAGNLKDRDILIRRIIHSKGDLYIDGVAMDIRAPRLIKVGHISEIRDISSGRVYDNPYEFIQNRLGVTVRDKVSAAAVPCAKDDFAKAIERVGQEVTVLMYLVAIDGTRDKSERQKVFEYAKSRTADLTYNDQELNDYIISLAPDEECFSMALAKSLAKDQSTVQGLVEAMLNVIMADGRVDDKERSFLIRIMDLLEQDGYEISLPV